MNLDPRPSAPFGVTVVIPTLNRGGFLVNSVKDLLAQEHRPLEILVVDQSERAPREFLELVERHPDIVTHLRSERRGLPIARNIAWRRARHDAIVYIDDDIRCSPEFVGAHARTLAEPRVGAVAGGIDEPGQFTPNQLRRSRGFRRWTASPLRGYGDPGAFDVDAFKGCNFSIWRHAVAAVGGFDERLNVGAALYEDLELCLRLREKGYRIRFDGSARLQHLAAPSGGCRVPNPREYVDSLAHNRALVMARHLRWYELPSALGRLGWLVTAYARANRDPLVLKSGIAGFLRGLPDGRQTPVCSTE
jgi:GT2 family glycosyltransferase